MAVKAPSGLTAERNKNVYTITWKRGAKYSAQSMYYKLDTDEKTTVSGVSGSATTKEVTIAKSGMFPKTDKKVSKITFSIKGKKGKKWSTETKKDYEILVPPKPKVTESFSNDSENRTTFAWQLDWGSDPAYENVNNNKDTTTAIFTNYQWWTALLPNSELDSDEVTSWQENGITTDDVTDSDKAIDEGASFQGNYSYTRYFKIVARGPAGESKPAYGKHVYAFPNAAKNVTAISVPLESGVGYRVSVQWAVDETKSRPIDSVSLEYAIQAPSTSYTNPSSESGTVKTSWSVPSIQSWSVAATVKDTTNVNGDISGASFIIDRNLEDDECIFVRVVTKHDNKTAPSEPVFVHDGYGSVSSPSGLSVTVDGQTASVTVTNESDLTASFVGIYYRTDTDPNPQLIGLWPAGRTQALSVKLPDAGNATSVSFGAKAFLADYSPYTPSATDVTIYAISNVKMQSDGIIWDARPVPKPPANITLSSPKTGIARITWDWTWTEANGVEISWADHDDAWESTAEPSTYVLENTRASAWNIAGLDVGTWYFRIRLFKVDGEAVTYGTYSDIKSIKLAATPATPVLTLSPSVVAPDGKVSCYWAFSATDGDEQVQADICEATISNTGSVTYGDIIARAENEQYKTLNISQLGWQAGSKHYLAVRVITASGEASNNWSVPKPIEVTTPVVCTINSTSLSIVSNKLYLTAMPLAVSATGAGESGMMTYILERADDYHLDRPDDSDSGGYKGETIAIIQKPADNANGGSANYDVSIGLTDLIGPLDDGASYNLLVVATDSNNQISAPAKLTFTVDWAHQAVVPSATISVDNEAMVTFITPNQPESGYASGDVCDIYRLSPDKPELILTNVTFNTMYVDPYPSLGSMGGHRVVYKTANGDYITAENEFAWTDYRADEGDIVDVFATVIDFGEDQVVLPYDLSLSNSWSKDFTTTKYLGGAIQGDWNPGVQRTGSVKGRVAVRQDSELVSSIRLLANYAGVCHVRTPDGSSYAANVDVTEDREEKKINMITSFTFNITKVDAQGFDGMTYNEWNKES